MTVPPLDARGFQAAIGVSDDVLSRLETYASLLQNWQLRVNLVSASTLDDLWRRHMLDSAQLYPLLPEGPIRIADLGTGAGFPGLVLAIMGADNVHLVESNARKCAFLRTVAVETGTAVSVHAARAEALEPLNADIVTARAFAPLDRLFGYAERHLSAHGSGLFLKGRNVDQELTESLKNWNMRETRQMSKSDASGVILQVEGLKRRHDR